MGQENEMGYGPAVSPQAKGAAQETEAQQTKLGMSDAQANLQSSRTPHRTDAAAGFAEEVSDEIGERVRDFQQRADRYVRENPIKAVFTAAGIGFVLGVISRR